MKDAFFLASVNNTAVTFSVVGFPQSDGVNVNYITLPGNSPKTNGNHIYVWQTTDNIVPWNKMPDGDTPVPSDDSSSTVKVNFPYQDKGYILGYATAATPNAVCATIYMPAGSSTKPNQWVYTNLNAQVVYFGTNLVQVQYTGLQLYTPATNKNWLGLWQGNLVPWSGDPLKSVNVTQDAPSSGFVTFQGMQLLLGLSYVVGYFMVEPKTGRTSLAAASSFTVGSSLKA